MDPDLCCLRSEMIFASNWFLCRTGQTELTDISSGIDFARLWHGNVVRVCVFLQYLHEENTWFRAGRWVCSIALAAEASLASEKSPGGARQSGNDMRYTQSGQNISHVPLSSVSASVL